MMRTDLQKATWMFDPEYKRFYLEVKDEHGIIRDIDLSITYAFSFTRFVLRVAKKYFYKGIRWTQRKKK